MRDNQVEEKEQLDREVLACKQSAHTDDKQMEMLLQAKDNLEW